MRSQRYLVLEPVAPMRDNTNCVLHQEGEWRLDRMPSSQWAWNSWLIHGCQQSRDNGIRGGAYALWGTAYECCACHERAPDGLIALWTLHNFDRIQRNGWGERGA